MNTEDEFKQLVGNVTKWRLRKNFNESKTKTTNNTLKIFESRLKTYMTSSHTMWQALKHDGDVVGYYHFYIREVKNKKNEDEALLRFFAQAIQKAGSQKNFSPADMLRQYRVVMNNMTVISYEVDWKYSDADTKMPKYTWAQMEAKVGKAALEPMAF